MFLRDGVAKRGERRFTAGKLRTLIYPYVLWSAIFYVGLMAFHRFTVQRVPAVGEYLVEVATGNVSWFLPTGRELVRRVLHSTAPLPQLVIPTLLAVGLPGLLYQYRERLRIGWMFVWPFGG